jgi:hypothetical protein
MLTPEDLTIITNASGIPTALGYPINSALLQAGQPLFLSEGSLSGGGGKKRASPRAGPRAGRAAPAPAPAPAPAAVLGIPAGLVGTIIIEDECAESSSDTIQQDTIPETIPESLYDKLMNLLMPQPQINKFTRKKQRVPNKHKTRKGKKNM